MNPAITTIIPTFRRPALLERAIQSVLSQGYPNSRVCVYDNASADDTKRTVTKIAQQDARVEYHCHSSNIGPWNNFKYGIGQVNTPYFHLLSDDDAILPGFFDAAMQGFSHYPNAGLFAGATIRFAPGFISTPVLSWPDRLFKAPLGFLEILRRDFPDWNAIMFTHRVIDRIGGIDVGFKNAIDLDFICRCAVTFDLIVRPVACAILTIGHDHLSKQMYSPATDAVYWARILDRYQSADWVDDNAREAFTIARKWIGRKIYKNALDAAASGRNQHALDATACLKHSFCLDSAPMLVNLMMAQSPIGAILRQGFYLIHASSKAVKAVIRRYRHKQDMRLVAAALALK